ncbi:hypothetical protein MAHJHV35_48030 [Mycobacterium avium subsp. hominissuis]
MAPGIPGRPGATIRRAALVVPRYGVRITVMARPPGSVVRRGEGNGENCAAAAELAE